MKSSVLIDKTAKNKNAVDGLLKLYIEVLLVNKHEPMFVNLTGGCMNSIIKLDQMEELSFEIEL